MQDPIVYLNGALTPLSEARIPVLDRGFIFGDGVYDVIPLYRRIPFRGAHHLARLFRSMAAIGIANPYDAPQWQALIDSVVEANSYDDQMVYLHVTRGVAKRAHAFPADTQPTIFIMTNPMKLPSAQMLKDGVACIAIEDQRWLHCEIKAISLLGNVLAAQCAAENDVTEAIQFRDGFLSEASASNVWIAKDGVLSAPPRDNLILEGIRYALVEELCAAQTIPFQARRIIRAEVFDADEVMLTSASKEILPVVRIDGKLIGQGVPGPLFSKLYAAYQAAKAAL
ncbi:D-amino acid aminotransferase [Herbaspirillum sp. RTI4]|uniref:D-amino acid aminotransferase n=1 Tax=Herbaspirillum sp. RTI4 TaxID=3048640 RepID=UPI002AB3BA76|nr:D-amino acid aminotransferase [Herbaspirillum sp. RTI4]MDY7577254.1 D-amino acid aminotransferase [Herbaspirillum sp. RTI4]MEA9980544.1 D-amino acid aminotransferase [Herbaspirillum sp. RTI4]